MAKIKTKEYNKTNHNPKNQVVFVVNKEGEPLMPTNRFGKVRKMLKSGDARVFKRDPHFTIQILRNTDSHIQEIYMGMDCGYTVGLSGIANQKEFLSAEILLRSKEIKDKLESRSSIRRTRRGNKTRYRKARFMNRGASKGMSKSKQKEFLDKKLAPTVKHLVESHQKIIDRYSEVLPVTNKNWYVEFNKFDIQKMENPDFNGEDYQHGKLFGYNGYKEYVKHRDGYVCQNPKCKNIDKTNPKQPFYEKGIKLEVHHIIRRSKRGTDSVTNLLSICTDCHTQANHEVGGDLYNLYLKNRNKIKKYRAATQNNVVGSYFKDYNKRNPDNQFNIRYGFTTNKKRRQIGLDKSLSNDAFCVAYPNKYFTKINDGEFFLNKTVSKLKSTMPIIDTNSKETGRRQLETFFDAKYLMNNGEILTGKQSGKVYKTIKRERMGRKGKMVKYNMYELISDKTKERVSLVKKGRKQFSLEKKPFPKNTITTAVIDGKKEIIVSGGRTGSNIYSLNHDKPTMAVKKYNVTEVTNRKGLIINYDTKTYDKYKQFKK